MHLKNNLFKKINLVINTRPSCLFDLAVTTAHYETQTRIRQHTRSRKIGEKWLSTVLPRERFVCIAADTAARVASASMLSFTATSVVLRLIAHWSAPTLTLRSISARARFSATLPTRPITRKIARPALLCTNGFSLFFIRAKTLHCTPGWCTHAKSLQHMEKKSDTCLQSRRRAGILCQHSTTLKKQAA